MPIIDVEVVLRRDEVLSDGAVRTIALGAGEVLGSGAGRTWVKVRTIDSSRYEENGPEPAGYAPAFVSVLLARIPERAVLKRFAAELSAVVGEACGRAPDLVHVLFDPEGAGRVAFGGQLV